MPKMTSLQDVIAKIETVFPDPATDGVLSILNRYGTKDYEREPSRVQLAILKLYDEEPQADLDAYVEVAKQDYRDVPMWVEYTSMSITPLDDRGRTKKCAGHRQNKARSLACQETRVQRDVAARAA